MRFELPVFFLPALDKSNLQSCADCGVVRIELEGSVGTLFGLLVLPFAKAGRVPLHQLGDLLMYGMRSVALRAAGWILVATVLRCRGRLLAACRAGSQG
jgi:hypothetical protein